MSDRFCDLITKSEKEASEFTEQERFEIKMGVWQMLDNLNFISCQFAYKEIRGENPTGKLKKEILSY